MSRFRVPGVVAATVALVGATTATAFAAGLSDPIPKPIRPANIDVRFQKVANGLESPVDATTAPGDRHHLFVADQNGKLWGLTVRGHHRHHGDRSKWLVADLSDLMVHDLAQVVPGLAYDERGFLGVVFDPR